MSNTSEWGKIDLNCAADFGRLIDCSRKRKIWLGPKDKQTAAAAAAIDDDSEKPTPNKIPRRENMQQDKDKQIATETTTDAQPINSFQPLFLSATEKNNWDPELLKVSYNDLYETLSDEKQRLWLKAHFILRRKGSAYMFLDELFFESDENEKLKLENQEEEEESDDEKIGSHREEKEEEKEEGDGGDDGDDGNSDDDDDDDDDDVDDDDDYDDEEDDYDDEEKEVEEYINAVNIVCSDGIVIDAFLFVTESRKILGLYALHLPFLTVESNSEIIKKVEFFCKERLHIKHDYAHDQILLQHKLNEFNSIFHQLYRADALHLIIAAFELNIISLMDLMMEEVRHTISKMTTDEVYNILSVNLTHYIPKKFEWMKQFLNERGNF